ncbi:MAG: energy-coupled thiamine transporter ThiT [Candidatus Muirbacterium halophilum]|nr:energy-coupled thiamine transporter ThiT [Candidatus Muirbacterium halophilum]MCK9477224.1 energy-coupled thiamine transporter ThiT [Candidatus Muirbacterium halophilum]
MNRSKITLMLEISIAAAIAIVLSRLRIYKLPYGGSVSLELFPIVYISFKRGISAGLFTGMLHAILSMIFIENAIITFFQPVLDYFVPSMVIAICGFGYKKGLYVKEFLFFIAMILNFLSHFLSGFLYYGQYASQGQSKYLYSAIYNISYTLPSAIAISIIIYIFERKKIFEFSK